MIKRIIRPIRKWYVHHAPVFALPKKEKEKIRFFKKELPWITKIIQNDPVTRPQLSPRAIPKKILKYGRPFITHFGQGRYKDYVLMVGTIGPESAFGVMWGAKPTRRNNITRVKRILGRMTLTFSKDTIFVESIQGIKTGKNGGDAKKHINRLNAALGGPWPNDLLRRIEETARETGYHSVFIRRPEHIPIYTNYKLAHDTATEIEVERVQKQMREFYGIIAKKNGYKKEGEYYVKRIKPLTSTSAA